MKILLALALFSIAARSDPTYAPTPLTIDCGSISDQFAIGGTKFLIETPGAIGDLTMRYGSFRYQVPIAPGVYDVFLTFRESGQITAAGQRSFSVKVNDHTVMAKFDLFATSKYEPLTLAFKAISDGTVSIALTFEIRNAILSFIKIRPAIDFLMTTPTETLREGAIQIAPGLFTQW